MATDDTAPERRGALGGIRSGVVEDRVFRLAFEHAAIGLALMSPDRQLFRANPALTQMLGCTEGQLCERNMASLAHPDDRQVQDDAHDELLAGGRASYELEQRYVRDDGSTVWVDLKVSAVTDDGGEITMLVAQIVDASEHVAALQASTWRADHDSLTGALNRAGLTRELDRSLRRGHAGRRTAVMYLDLDQFKKLNDVAGHAAGDRYLVMLVERLNQTVRKGDAVARVGGDEFVLLVRDVPSATQARIIAENVLAAVQKLAGEHRKYSAVTVSIGVSVTSFESCTVVLANADRAMYAAKRLGGNQVTMVDGD